MKVIQLKQGKFLHEESLSLVPKIEATKYSTFEEADFTAAHLKASPVLLADLGEEVNVDEFSIEEAI
jgi:hypothetical protein